MAEEKELIAYCGLYCGDCFAHRGVVADLARDLRKELRQAKFNHIAQAMSETSFFAVYKDYPRCYEVLGALVKFRCKKTCRFGGGPPFCKIRKCCQNKGLEGCWQCNEFETCESLDFLKTSHGEAHLKNLKKLKKEGVDNFIKGKRYW
jgi:hypothetical protein